MALPRTAYGIDVLPSTQALKANAENLLKSLTETKFFRRIMCEMSAAMYQLTDVVHLAQMQALPSAGAGTKAITAGENTASKHQQRSALVPFTRAISAAQALFSWQIGHCKGLMLSMNHRLPVQHAFCKCIFDNYLKVRFIDLCRENTIH